MTRNVSNSGSSATGEGSSQAAGRSPGSFDGPETVINPERRGVLAESGLLPRTGEGSSLWTRLFPRDTQADRDATVGPIGCRLGHFVIESAIGSGGMGAVFRAVDERLNRIVALKVLAPSLSRDPASTQRFLNEARAAAQLDHENIARVYYVGDEHGLHFIAHEFVTGQNLRDLIQQHGPLDTRDAVNYTLQIAAALRHTSAAGVVHRDIKPSNIIINARGRAKLVDLGLAKKVASESLDLTIAGTTLGTFDYISPEQAKDPRQVDVRSDIYSLGCTLYHMLTGEPPYPEGTVLQKLLDHQAKDVPDPAIKNRRTPPRLAAIVRRMMAADPRERFSTPDDLILELLPVAAELGLRGVNPEGLVWTSQAAGRRTFVERNVAWIAIGAVLVLFAVLIDRYPRVLSDRSRSVAKNEAGFAADVAPTTKSSESRKSNEDREKLSGPASTSGTAPVKSGSPGESATADNLSGRIPFQLMTDPENIFEAGTGSPLLPPPTVPNSNLDGRQVAAVANPGQPADGKPAAPVQPGAPRSGAAERTSPADALQPAEISISDGVTSTSYATLEAAVADAKDGSSIDLKYNGPRPVPEKPFRVSGKRITIRGSKGFRPIVSFAPRDVPAAEFESRMITIANGSVELVDVDIQAVVPEAAAADRWSLFSLGPSDRLRLSGANVTISNPGNRQAEAVDISADRDQLADRMAIRQAGPMGSPQEFEVELEHAFVRGGCALFAVRATDPGRLEVKQSVLALHGALLANWGDDDSPGEGKRLSLRLEHVTCFLGGGLVQMDGGEVPRFLAPVVISARNNIFASNSTTALFAFAGRTSDEDCRRLVRWEGARNFYDRFAAYWSLASSSGETAAGRSSSSAAGAGGTPPLQFDDWKRLLGGDAEVEANASGIVWKESWQAKPFASISNADFQLADVNVANSGATDGTDVGADLRTIHPILDTPRTKDAP